jgi:hypothetical protein
MYKTLGPPALSMTDWPGESYDPLLMSPVKATSVSVDEGRRWVKEGFLSLKTINNRIVCVPFRGWMGKTKYLSAFELGMVGGARRTSLSVKNWSLGGFFTLKFPVCIKNGPPPKGHPANLTQLLEALESTWASVPVEHFPHLVGVSSVLYTVYMFSLILWYQRCKESLLFNLFPCRLCYMTVWAEVIGTWVAVTDCAFHRPSRQYVSPNWFVLWMWSSNMCNNIDNSLLLLTIIFTFQLLYKVYTSSK